MKNSFTIQESLSEPGGSCNEDVFGMAVQDDRIDLWIIDGATSIAEQDRLGLGVSDPAWFAQTVGTMFGSEAARGQDVPAVIKQAVRTVSEDYEARTRDINVPIFEKPLAALGWMRMTPRNDGVVRIQMWGLGDTRFLIGQGESVMLFPKAMRGDLTGELGAKDDGPRSRTGVLLSHVADEKKQRGAKHTDPRTARLGFHPDSIDFADREELSLHGDFTVLAMSDGFYRLVDEYRLYDDVGLLHAAGRGLEPLYKQLRAHEDEAEARHDLAVKRRDDATAIYLHCHPG